MKRIILFFLLAYSFTFSSGQGFGAELLVGANFSQVDGDQLAGYDKLGLNAGLQINREINEKWEGAFEIRFSMKGARTVVTDPDLPPPLDLTLNYHYLEIPFLAKYIAVKNFTFYAGPSLGINVVNQRNENGRESEELELNTLELGLQLGGTYYLTDKVGLDLRHSYSLSSIRNVPIIVNGPTWFGRAGWYNRLFTIGINYRPSN